MAQATSVKTYVKGSPVQLSTNFKSTEFDCHGKGCCTKTLVDQKLIVYLQKIRNHFGKSVNINSGFRCKTHNASVGGASKSNHMDGEAADIQINGVKPIEIAQYAESIGVLGIGVYSQGVHIDTRTTKYFWYDGGESNVKTFGGTPTKETEKEETKNDTSKVDTSAADPKVIWDFLKKKGFNDFGIAGLMGNLYAESGLRPSNLQNTYEKSLKMTDAEYVAAVDSGTYTNFIKDAAGFGLAQWTYWSRKQNLLEFAQKQKKSIGDLQMQLEFLYQELQSYKSVFNTLKTAGTVLEASNAVLLQYERPDDQSISVQTKRAEFGQKYYDSYADKKSAQNSNEEVAELKLIEAYATKNPCYTANVNKVDSRYTKFQENGPEGLMLHSVGCPQPSASVFVKNWNKESYDRACVHAFIDANTGEVYQLLPWNFRGWHGGGSSNNTHVGVEMCEPSCIKYTSGASFTCSDLEKAKKAVKTTYDAAVQLFAMLCKLYNLNPLADGVIVSHAEGYKRGIASNHGDPEHLWRQLGMDYTMNTFRNDVKKAIGSATVPEKEDKEEAKAPEKPVTNTELYRVRKTWEDAKSQIGAYRILDNAKKACKSGYKVFDSKGNVVYPEEVEEEFPYRVKVLVAALNYRSGPGTNYPVRGTIRDQGIYTIVDSSKGSGANKGWGKLKSGAGWISMDYVKKM